MSEDHEPPPGVQPTLNELVTVPGGTLGPYVARSKDAGLAVWIAPDGDTNRWHTLPLTGGQPLPVADASPDTDLIVARGAPDGFVVVSTSRKPDYHAVHALGLGPSGALRQGPETLSEGEGRVVWVEALPLAKGSFVMWAIVNDQGIAQLKGQSFGVTPDAEQHTLFKDCLAWQTAPFAGGVALAAVTPSGDLRTIQTTFVDAQGAPAKDPLTVQTRGRIQLDLDMVAVEDALTLAWSEERELESVLMGASIDKRGTLRQAPKRVTAPQGEQTLVRLVPPFASGAPAYIAWENLRESPRDHRRVWLAPLGPHVTLGAVRAVLRMYGNAPTLPEFSPTKQGLTAITQAPLCPPEQPTCPGRKEAPVFVRFDERLHIVASGPVWPAALPPAELAWGLGCGESDCNVLSARLVSPTPIYVTELRGVDAVHAPAAERLDLTALPSVLSEEAFIEVDPIADIAISRRQPAQLVTWLTDFDPTLPYERPKVPAPDGRYAPVRALLRFLGPGDKEPYTVSWRARTLGGVALAESPASQTLLAWSAIDNQAPQVFLTMLDATGKKRLQKMLTRGNAEVSDMAAAWGDNSWIVAWVDERHNDPEVYAAKVAEGLVRIGNEQRLTDSPGLASDLVMLRLEDRVLLLWGDTRGSTNKAWANMFSTTLSLSDASSSGPATRVSQSTGHAHSPVLARFKEGAVAAWIESRAEAPGLALARFNPKGELIGDPVSLPADGALTGLTMDCAETCRLIFARAGSRRAELWSTQWTPGTAPSAPRFLAPLTGPPDQRVAPVLADNVLIYADQAPDGATRLRRMVLRWE